MRTITFLAAAALILGGAAGAPADDRTEISGFVDAAYFYDFNAEYGTFSLDQAEIDIEHQASEKVGLRADLEWIRVADGSHEARIEQGFLTWAMDARGGLVFGKWNAPIGFEALDPVDMFQYSHSLVFTYGAPENLTGLRYDRVFGQVVDIKLYGVNGWDLDTNTNRRYTWGGRLGLTHGVGNVGFTAITGRENEFDPDTGELDLTLGEFERTLFDIDLTVTPENWVIGGEFNTGTKTDAFGAEQKWTGYLVMANFAYNSWGSFTARWDEFDDPDGYAFGVDTGLKRRSLTFADLFTISEGAGALVELRFDTADKPFFYKKEGSSNLKKSTVSIAFEMTFVF